MPATPLIEVWRSQAVVLLRNGYSIAELQHALANAVEQTERERGRA